MIVIPAGVAHQRVGLAPGFRCVGAYPAGQRPDMQYGKPGERPRADHNIRAVPLPSGDPAFGGRGPLVKIWAGDQGDPPVAPTERPCTAPGL